MLPNGFPIRLILISLVAFGGPAAWSQGQDDDAPEKINETKTERPSTFSSTIGKIFGRKDKGGANDLQANPSESNQDSASTGPSVPGKPSFGFSRQRTVPAQPAGNRGGGIFVPLKSFTNRVFRGGENPELGAISVEAEEEYANNITRLERMARNRAVLSSDDEVIEEETSALRGTDSEIASDRKIEGNEVGSSLRTAPSLPSPETKSTTTKSAATKPSLEPFANSRANSSANRNTETSSEGQKSISLPPPPSLVPSTVVNQATNDPAPILRPENGGYNGANSNSSRATVSTPGSPLARPASKPAAPITSVSPNLEDRSTSRRTPVGATGITESLELHESSNNKPTSLVDLSNDGNAPLPTSISRSRSRTSQLSSDKTAGSEAVAIADEKGEVSTSDEPSVTRNRVPELKTDKPSTTRTTPSQTPAATSGLSKSGLPEVSVVSPEKSQVQPSAPTRDPVGASSGSLLELKQPGISINIAGPNAMVVGQETIYELVAKNQGTSNLNGLIVRLSLPNSVEIGTAIATSGTSQPDREDGDNAILWEVETILAGQTQSLKLPLKTASPEHFAMNLEWTALPQSQSLQVNVHEPKLDLALEGPAEAEYGVPQKYRLRIKNPGNAVAKTVEVRLAAESFGSNQSVVGDIAPGAERVIDVELLFEQGGVIPILATATSSVSHVQSQSQIDVRVRQAKLAVKWDGSTNYYQGSVGDYRLILANEGDAAINQAKCSVNIPVGAEPIALPPGSVRRGNSVQWDVKKLMPGESVTVPFRFTFSQLGQVELVLQADAKNSGAVVAKHSITVDALEDLKLAVIPPVAPAPVDQPVPYEIEIHNRGTKAAQNVSVLAQFSEGVEPVKVEGHTGQIVPGQVLFENIPSIGANERITLKVFAQASSSGVHRFRAEVKGSSGEADLVQEGSTRYMASGTQPQFRR